MKLKQKHRCAVLLGFGLIILLFWGTFSLLLDLQPTSYAPSHLVIGAIGKFLLFPMAICLFSYVFWALLIQVKQLVPPTVKVRRILVVGALILPVVYLISLPCLFFSTPFQEFFAAIFPALDKLLYTPPVICIIVVDMLPLAIAFET